MHVSLISDESITELTQGTDFTVTDRVVTLAAATTLKIKIYRQTATKPLVGWADASVLKAADMTVQSTQLLHLAEETSDLAQDGGLSKDTTDNVWDAKFNKIKNLLDPTDPGDAVTLSYITKNQDSLLNQLKSTGAAQNAAIVSTGDAQNARLTATGDNQNTRLTTTGDTQNTRLVTTGDSYVNTMTTLRDATATKATEANNSADLAKKWAVSASSPDGATDSKSSKTWAEEAKTSASNSAASASASKSSASASASSATNSANSANASKQSASASANSASASASSASAASTSATKAANSATNAAQSASAAAQSAENAKTWDPTQYVKDVTEADGVVTVTKGGGGSETFNVNKALNDFIASRTLKAGETVSISNTSVCGYISSGGMSFRFSLPVNKISADVLQGTLTGSFIFRQNGNYIFGSDNASNPYDLTSYFTFDICEFNPNGFISVWLRLKKTASYVDNNNVFAAELKNLVFHVNES